MKKIWYLLYRIIMEASDLSCRAKKKISMSSPLSSLTFFLLLIAIWVIGDLTVKGAYATSTSRPSSESPYALPLHGDKMNKHQVRIFKKFRSLRITIIIRKSLIYFYRNYTIIGILKTQKRCIRTFNDYTVIL